MSAAQRWGAVAFVAAVTVARAAFVATTRDDPLFRVPYLDGAFYHVWARSLAEGRGDFVGPYFLGPLYPHAVAMLYRLFGPEAFGVRVAQSALGVLDVGLVLVLGRRLFGALAGFVAAALLALYGPMPFHEGLLVMETLLLTLVLGALFVLVVPGWNAALRGAACGLLLGLAGLGRPTALVAVPVAMAFLWSARGRGSRVRGAAACALGCIVVLLPVLVRNARLGGGLAISTNGGVNFYAGNSPGANGRYREPKGVHFFTTPVLDAKNPGVPLPPAIAERALTVAAVAGTEDAAHSAEWRQRAWSWIGSHPLDYVQLELRKLWLVLQAREVPQIESYDFQRRRLPGLRAHFIDFTWIWPLAALGIWRARRERVAGWKLVAGFAASMLIPCLAFFVTSRYRLSAVPELALLAGYGAATLVDGLRRRETRQAGLALAAIAPLALATRLGGKPPRNAPGWENAQMAERLYALGDLPGAIHYMEEASRWLPERLEVQLDLALYWSERAGPGDLQRSEALLRAIAHRAPDHAVVQFNLGAVLDREGRHTEALDAWREALRLDPQFAPARERLQQSEARDTPPTP